MRYPLGLLLATWWLGASVDAVAGHVIGEPVAGTPVADISVAGGSTAGGSSVAAGWLLQAAPGLQVPRAAHKTTALAPDLLLVSGGCSGLHCSPVERSAELWQPGGHSQTAGLMSEPRVSHLAVRLTDGRVLLAGGWTGERTTASAELFSLATRQFQPGKPMQQARMDASATLLADGRVLIAGGARATNQPIAAAELFVPALNVFVPAGTMQQARAHHAAVRLQDGRVLLMGGLQAPRQASRQAELFDPATGTFSATGAMLQARCKHAAVLLHDGRVLVIAGSADCDDRARLAQTELYDPSTGQFSPGPVLQQPRYKIVDAAAVLPGGEVVVAGDASDVEIWQPGSAAFVKVSTGIGAALAFSSATPLADGRLLVLGGYDDDIRPTAGAWLLSPLPRTAAVPLQKQLSPSQLMPSQLRQLSVIQGPVIQKPEIQNPAMQMPLSHRPALQTPSVDRSPTEVTP